MQSNVLKNTAAKAPRLVIHPLTQEDSVAVAALRSVVAPMKGKIEGTAGRGPFNGIMERVPVPASVTFQARYARRDIRLVGQAGAGPERARDYSRARRLVQLGDPPRRTGTSLATSL